MGVLESLDRLERTIAEVAAGTDETPRKTRAVGDPPTAADLDAITRSIANGVRAGIREGLADLRNEVASLRSEQQAANRLHAERLGSGLQKINRMLATLLPNARKSATNPLPAATRKPPPGATGS